MPGRKDILIKTDQAEEKKTLGTLPCFGEEVFRVGKTHRGEEGLPGKKDSFGIMVGREGRCGNKKPSATGSSGGVAGRAGWPRIKYRDGGKLKQLKPVLVREDVTSQRTEGCWEGATVVWWEKRGRKKRGNC